MSVNEIMVLIAIGFIVIILIAGVIIRIRAKDYDPVYGCEVHKEIGCSHVDGYLCDFPDCDILKNYRQQGKCESFTMNLTKEDLE